MPLEVASSQEHSLHVGSDSHPRAPPAQGITDLPLPGEPRQEEKVPGCVFPLCSPSLGIITGIRLAASKGDGVGRQGVGSLAPEERLDGCQVLSYSIPAAVERGKQHFTLLAFQRGTPSGN